MFVYFYLEMGMKCQGLLLLKIKTKFTYKVLSAGGGIKQKRRLKTKPNS